MNQEIRLGIRAYVYECIVSSLLGIFSILVSMGLPIISRNIFGSFISLTEAQALLVVKAGNMLVALFFLGGIALIFFGLFLSWIRHISTTYTLMDNALKTRRGLIAKREIIIPYKGIQAVNINQSIIERLAGVAGMIILSAATDVGNEVAKEEFDLIDVRIAKKLQIELLKKANVQEVVTSKQ